MASKEYVVRRFNMGSGNFQEATPKLYNQGIYEESSVAKHMLGTVRELADGRKFVYCKATAANIAAGIAIGKPCAPQNCTIAATDAAINLIGVRKITLTLTGTPTLNLYADGYMVLTAGTGLGQIYKIRGNTADDTPASGRCTFYLYDALATTHVTATTTIDVYENLHSGLYINPTVTDGSSTTGFRIAGITQRAVTASYYFWAQIAGIGSAMIETSTSGAEGDERYLVTAASTAGYLRSVTAAYAIGIAVAELVEMTDQANGEAALVNLKIG